MLAEPLDILRDVIRRTLRPPETMTVDQWADRYRMLPTTGNRGGRWKTIVTQYLREPMRDFTDPAVSRIVLRFGTQSAKTEFLLNCLAYSVDRQPHPTLYVMDTVQHAEEVMKDRIRPVFETGYLRKHMPSDRTEKGLLRVRFASMIFYMTGSNSAGGLANKTIRTLMGDELDKWPGVLGGRGGTEAAAVKVARQRMHAFGDDKKEILASSPTDEGFGIDKEYQESDRASFAVPCPHCAHYQVPRFKVDGKGGVRWEGGVGAQLSEADHLILRERVKQSAWYECESCEGKIGDEHKPLMIALGVWIRPGQEARVVDAKAFARGAAGVFQDGYDLITPEGVRIVGDRPRTSVHGYHISQLVSPFVPFGEIAEEFVAARGNPERDFINGRLGEPWCEKGARSDAVKLIENAKQTPEGEQSYRRGTVPAVIHSGETQLPGVLSLIGTIDVQKDKVWYLIHGWGEAEQSWWVECGSVPCPETVDTDTGEVLDHAPADNASIADKVRYAKLLEDNWAAVAELVERRFPVIGTTSTMPVAYWGIDSGDRTHEVYAFCRRMGQKLLAMKGSEQMNRPWDLTNTAAIVRDRKAAASQAARQAGDVDLLLFWTHYWKDYVYSHLERRPPMHGAWRYPVDLPEEWARQVTAEERVVEQKRSRRNLRPVWRLRPNRSENHLFDCSSMMVALADHLGVARLTARPAPAAKSAGPRVGGVRTGR